MSSSHNDLVSIITPTYNSERFISETIQSVLNQTYENWELLITDDASCDATFNILKRYSATDDRIHIFRLEKNMGAAHARNHSIRSATGRLIAFLDADDKWLPSKLSTQIEFMFQHNIDLSYSSYYLIHENGLRSGKFVESIRKLDYKKLLRNNYIGCLTAIYDTKNIGKIYVPEIKKRQDWALWLRIAKLTDKIQGLHQPLAEYRMRESSISSDKWNLVKYNWKIYRDIEKFSLIKSLLLFSRFLFFLAKKRLQLIKFEDG